MSATPDKSYHTTTAMKYEAPQSSTNPHPLASAPHAEGGPCRGWSRNIGTAFLAEATLQRPPVLQINIEEYTNIHERTYVVERE